MTDPYSELQDPSTSPQRLSELAAAHPELGPWIAAHPNAYPELQQWIATYAQPAPPEPAAAPAAESVQPAATTPAAPPADPFAQPAPPVDPFGGPAAAGPAAYAQEPASPFPGAAPYTASSPASQDGAPAPTTPRKSRKGLVIGLSIGVVVALVLAGGGVWWFFASRLGGASSPEAAFSKLVSGVEGMDPLTLYGSFAPSEVGLLKDPIEKIVNARPKDADKGVDVQKLLDQIRSNVHVGAKDMTYTTAPIADTVARVTWTGGQITIDGDAAKIADAVVRAYEPALRSQYEQMGYGSSEIDDAIADQKRSLTDEIDLPQTITPEKVSGDSGIPASLVMVDEGSGWYVSPLLSYADIAYQQSRDSARLGTLGTEIVPATSYSTPEDAASGLAQAALSGDIDQLAGSLPLAERRLLSIYGSALPQGVRDSYRSAVRNVSLTDSSFASTIDGDHARLSITKLGVSVRTPNQDVGKDLVSTWSIAGTCADWSYEYPSYNGYSFSRRGSSWSVETAQGSGCLADIPGATKLGADDLALIAVKEDGGWLVSPTATIGDAIGVVTTHILPYYESGTLDELFQ
ncbi:hypothetical protein [Microbacterium sp. SORGH_AS_0888]|uniref:variant leucine-rich repeat-containing protein n=1 Tax=Microbacterium sp. SORGH_AS_0888 TaxID=3041791 RepID=UPI00277D3321|nr:hypothetical protein [Microbacterium sp. SORGH_AS_0888]MDQ1129167.1 hypothetical protein [Microbacterium sp. SORGH_AS_0888]